MKRRGASRRETRGAHASENEIARNDVNILFTQALFEKANKYGYGASSTNMMFTR